MYVDGPAKRMLNCKVAPCDPPYADMEFKGYDMSNDGKRVSAWFVRKGATGPGTRRPSKSRGSTGKTGWWHSSGWWQRPEDTQDTNKQVHCKKARWDHWTTQQQETPSTSSSSTAISGPCDPEI